MRASWTLFFAVLAGCAGTQTTRAPLVPPLALDTPVVEPAPRARADADRSPPLPMPDEPIALPGATAPVYRTVTETVEVAVPTPVDDTTFEGTYYDPVYDRYLYEQGWYAGRAAQRSTRFPINTAIGAGIGAIIGHQRGRRDRGALIGGAAGLLLDLSR